MRGWKLSAWRWLALGLALVGIESFGGAKLSRAAAVYDHIVIVIEENESINQIIGSASAPYINQLANSGASFSNFYGITHPSQPNYLQLFSGSSQGITRDVNPTGLPFTTPNLGAGLIAAGKTFGAYSETLPSAGFVGDSGKYVQRHDPWVDWLDGSANPAANTLPPSVHQPFTSFPSDFTQLPTVSFVIPNLDNDMHDGPIAQGDTWLQTNIGAYNTWAQTHNSLLIVTWDEDNFQPSNRIPTIFSGANVKPGVYDTVYTHHNTLRTIEDMYSLPRTGAAAIVNPIVGPFVGDVMPSTATRSFQQGTNGYASTRDTHVRSDQAATNLGGSTTMLIDSDASAAAGNQPSQALIRFDDIVGNQASQVPAGAHIVSARLWLTTATGNASTSGNLNELHQMLVNWDPTSTWNTLSGGISPDGIEAVTETDFALEAGFANTTMSFVVTAAVQRWVNGEANFGWTILAAGADDWSVVTSEGANAALRPRLEIVYQIPEPSSLLLAGMALLGLIWARRDRNTGDRNPFQTNGS